MTTAKEIVKRLLSAKPSLLTFREHTGGSYKEYVVSLGGMSIGTVFRKKTGWHWTYPMYGTIVSKAGRKTKLEAAKNLVERHNATKLVSELKKSLVQP